MNVQNPAYKQWLTELKGKIRSAQIKAAIAVNTELILFYWDLGKMIAEKQTAWGTKFLQTLSKDLQNEFPDMKGFSVTNLKYCKLFFEYFSSQAVNEIEELLIRQQAVAQIQSTDNQDINIRPQSDDKLFFSPQIGDEIRWYPVFKMPWGHIKRYK